MLPSITMPTSMARPPAVVTISAGGGASVGGAFGVVAHQQEREDGGQLPEDVEHDQVVADDQAEHGAGERDEFGGEAGQSLLGVPVVVMEVVGAVEQHQRADRQYQHAHDRRERVEPQRDVHRQLGQPLDVGGRRPAGIRPVQRDPDQRTRRHQRQRVERHPAPPVDEEGSHRGRDRVGEKDGEHGTPIRSGCQPCWGFVQPQSTEAAPGYCLASWPPMKLSWSVRDRPD